MRSRNNKRNNGGKRIIILSVIGVFTILAFVIGLKLITEQHPCRKLKT